jgi:FkbM family methyltransferase
MALIDDNKTVSPTPFKVTTPELLPPGTFDTILVTSAYWVAICNKLDSLAIGTYLVVNPAILYEHLVLTYAESVEWHDNFGKVERLLATREQQELYRLVVGSRSIQPELQRDLYEYYKRHGNNELEYFEYINTKRFSTIIEGGVFDGANTLEFARRISNSGVIYGFEPNLNSSTMDTVRSLVKDTVIINLYAEALWSKRTSLPFYKNSENLQGARVVSESSGYQELVEIPAISIDEFVAEQKLQKVDYIKLDVEGAELDVLHGAINTLQRDRPQLAICIYHKKEHLFKIPLFLDDVLADYQYFIGHYSPTFWDTVWYAIPNELVIQPLD